MTPISEFGEVLPYTLLYPVVPTNFPSVETFIFLLSLQRKKNVNSSQKYQVTVIDNKGIRNNV